MWNSIAYVGSGLTLVAFIVSVIYYFDSKKRKTMLKSIELLPKNERRQSVETFIKDLPFPIDANAFSEENKFLIIRMQLRSRLIKPILICICLTSISAYSIYKVASIEEIPQNLIIKEQVNSLKRKILGNELRSSWESNAFPTNDTIQKKVLANGRKLSDKLSSITDDYILPLNKIDREQYTGYALFMAAEAAFFLGKKSEQFKLIKASIEKFKSARRAINNFIQTANKNPTEENLKYKNLITDDVDLHRISLLESMCLSLAFCTLSLNEKLKIPDCNLSEINSKMKSIPEDILTSQLEMNLKSERWLIKTYNP